MSFIEKLIAGFIERSCKNYVTTIVGLLSVLLYAYAKFSGMVPAAEQDYFAAVAELLSGVALILAKDTGSAPPPALPSVDSGTLKKLGVLLFVFLMIPILRAQTAGTPPTNLYAGGASYNNAAKPSVAGTALYARLVSADTNTYAFTVVDILPVSAKPFTVSTNIGAGVAQKAFTFNGLNVYIPTSAGISITGTNTGWSWSGGALIDWNVKKAGVATKYHIMPNVRFLKSSVSNGASYQVIGGVLFGWGQ